MNKAKILQLLKQPGLLSTINAEELKEVVNQYPYFSVGQILLAIKFEHQKNQLHKEQLAMASLSSNNREQLKSFFESAVTETAQPSEVHNIEKQATKSGNTDKENELKQLLKEIQEKKRLFLNNEPTKETPPIDLKEEIGPLEEIAAAGAEYIPTAYLEGENEEDELFIEHDAEMESNTMIEEEFIIHEIEAELNTAEIEKISSPELQIILDEEGEALMENEDLAAAEIISEQIIDVEVSSLTKSEQLQTPDQDFRINETVSSPGEFLPNKAYSFSGWLKLFSMNKMKEEQADNKWSENVIEKSVESSRQETSDPLFRHNMQSELETIDQIISTMKPQNPNEVISAEDLAKRSSELNEEIVSETLAAIYEDQALYEKAIRMYVKLSLKYPSKVSLFAARIKELKNKK